jgi:hypothetical protein
LDAGARHHEDAMVSERPETASEVSPPANAGTRLRGLLRRPAVWLLGIVGTVVAGYVTATLHDLAKPLQSYVSDLSCEWRKSSLSPDEPKFTILVARLQG